jgi:hypothetical protein
MGRPTQDRQAGATREADRYQADYFRDELHRQIEDLNEQAEAFRTALAKHLRRSEIELTERIQRELRLMAVERRKLLDMLCALSRRFPRDGADTDPLWS